MLRRIMTLCYYINGSGFISLFYYSILWRNTLCSVSFLCSRSTPFFLLPSLHCLPGGRSLTLPWGVNDASSFLMTVGAFCYSPVQTVALCSALFPSSCRHVFHRFCFLPTQWGKETNNTLSQPYIFHHRKARPRQSIELDPRRSVGPLCMT